MLHPLDVERWPEVPSWERHAPPPKPLPPIDPVNRWGDTAQDQARRRRALLRAMRERRRGKT